MITMINVLFSSFFLIAANPKDWSDHALWWPARNIWLTRTRSTLDQVGLHADALLHFTPMHKILRVQVNKLRKFLLANCRRSFNYKSYEIAF
jgi:kindlin 2